MNRYLKNAILLLAVTASPTVFAQHEEPQLGEFLRRGTQADEFTMRVPLTLVDRAFDAMYDLDFHSAESDLGQFMSECPNDPRGPAAQAASILFSIFEQHKILQSELFTSDDGYTKRQTVVVDEASLRRFDTALNRAEQLATQALGRNPSDENALFSLTLVYGLQADYAALVEHRDLAALRFSDKGNERARQLLAISPQFYDAYVATGIQKYLVGLKSAPVRWMLRIGGIKGDQDEGIRELQLAAGEGRYLAPFARMLLAVAHLRRQERQEGMVLLVGLRQQFPHNPLFAEEIARLSRPDATPTQQTATFPTGAQE